MTITLLLCEFYTTSGLLQTTTVFIYTAHYRYIHFIYLNKIQIADCKSSLFSQ